MLVAEALEVPGQQVDQAGGRPLGRLNQVYGVAFVFLGAMSGSGLRPQEQTATQREELVQRLRTYFVQHLPGLTQAG